MKISRIVHTYHYQQEEIEVTNVMKKEEIIKLLNSEGTEDKLNVLSHLCDVFESTSTLFADMNDVIQLLVNQVVEETNIRLKEEYINTIQFAANNRDISEIDFDRLISIFDVQPSGIQLNIIDILGFSHNTKYLDFLKGLALSEKMGISSTAAMAVEEMEAFIGKNSG